MDGRQWWDITCLSRDGSQEREAECNHHMSMNNAASYSPKPGLPPNPALQLTASRARSSAF